MTPSEIFDTFNEVLGGSVHADTLEFYSLLAKMALVHKKKGADYAPADNPLANVREAVDAGVEPWRAAWVRALDKVRRIKTYCQTGKLENEGVEDAWLDMAAYCLLAHILHSEVKST